MDMSASMPSMCAPAGLTGTPMTGRGVKAATMPGRWAAPPAPAMITCTCHVVSKVLLQVMFLHCTKLTKCDESGG